MTFSDKLADATGNSTYNHYVLSIKNKMKGDDVVEFQLLINDKRYCKLKDLGKYIKTDSACLYVNCMVGTLKIHHSSVYCVWRKK